MQLNEVQFPDVTPIDGYGPGFFRVAGEVHEGPLLVLPTYLRRWGGYGDAGTLLEVADDIDVLFVGTGEQMGYLPRDLSARLEGAGIGVEVMASPSACRTYNVLLGEGRRVGAALLPV